MQARLALKQMKRTTVVTIGNFDGVHRGHQAIMDRTVELARELRSLAVVVSFTNHSEAVLGEAPFLINTPSIRREMLQRQNLDALLEVPFDRNFAALTPTVFFETWLIQALGVAALVVGYDFKFGASGQGDFQLLKELTAGRAIRLERIAPVYEGGEIISSSKIRQLLAEGQLETANQMLGYGFIIEGQVINGEKLGRKLGFPTANIRLESAYLLPCYGVYLVRLFTGDHAYYGLANVGIKPTFGQYQPLIEVYLLDVELNLYGQMVRIEFMHFIRPESRFSGPEALKTQITSDVESARALLGRDFSHD